MADDPTRHLAHNRPFILERAAIASALSALPLPIIDELLAGAVRTTLVKRIAATRHVDVSDAAVEALAHPRHEPLMLRAGRVLLIARTVRRSFGKLIALFHIAARVEDVATTFAVATLFDHYCARHHVGAGLDETRAALLRRTIDGAIIDARLGLTRRGLGRAWRGTTNLFLAAPRRAARRARDAIVPLLGPADAEVVAPGTRQPSGKSALTRALDTIAASIGASGAGWVEELVLAFDARWTSGPSTR